MKKFLTVLLLTVFALSFGACGQEREQAYVAENTEPLETGVLFDRPDQAVVFDGAGRPH